MFKILAALLAVMAIVYSNCAPAEEREVEEEGQTDQIFYDIFSSCRNSSDCASRLISVLKDTVNFPLSSHLENSCVSFLIFHFFFYQFGICYFMQLHSMPIQLALQLFTYSLNIDFHLNTL